MTEQWIPIRYRGYWDVPRIFLSRFKEQLYLFDCPFSEELDEYPDVYSVYILPPQMDDDLPTDWTLLPGRATRVLGEVPVGSVQFDPSRRAAIQASVFELIRPLTAQSLNGHTNHDPSRHPVA